MHRTLPLALCGLLALSACAAQAPYQETPGPAPGQPEASRPVFSQEAPDGQAAGIVRQAAGALREMRQASPRKMLDAAIEDARAIIILPGVYQAGFMYSVHGGSGVLLARRPDGGWGAPVFVSVAGAGYGPQLGLERSRLVLAVMEEEMLLRILDSGLSFDAAATFDILGVREQTSRDSLTEGRPVMAFADGVGLMAGVALRGGALGVSQTVTRDYHGPAAGSVQEIMRGTSAPGLEVFQLWGALVVEQPGPEIIRVAPGK